MNKPEHRSTVLIVDDSPNNIHLLGAILREDHRVLYATQGRDALTIARQDQPDLILLDILMPDMDGFQVCEALQAQDLTRHIPVILVTGMDDNDAETRGFASGAVDFLTKPVNPMVVRTRVRTHLMLKQQKDELERTNSQLLKEVSERQRLENQLREQAEFDTLTGLPNRNLFQDRLQQTILLGARNERERQFALMFLDLDRFKWVNDTLGHDAGDQLLVEVARRIKQVVRKSDSVARWGGDEFTVILPDILHESMVELVARKILEQLSQPFWLKGQEVAISGSVGIVLFPMDGNTALELIKNADSAMYFAKESGRNAFQFYSREIHQRAHLRMQMDREMRKALQNDEFYLDYQPKVHIASRHIYGMEALVRWDHPQRGILFPRAFIPLAEETGLIVSLDAWVLRHACREVARWIQEGFPALKLSVNLSAIHFREGDRLVDLVEDALRDSGLPVANLELEITESMMMESLERVSVTLARLRDMGVTISMDDFGTGYSSLALLKKLPVHVLKIDRSFITDMSCDPKNPAFISAIIRMAEQLDLQVVAEGVESFQQLETLKSHGGANVQGYYYSPPLSKAAFLALLQGRIPLGGAPG